jgi:spore coat protein JB
MDMNREQLLKEVMAADFTLIELNLYLDTHPCDQRAINMFNTGVQRAMMLRANFEKNYGPLTPFAYSKSPWQWIESPWPWEAEHNPDYR